MIMINLLAYTISLIDAQIALF